MKSALIAIDPLLLEGRSFAHFCKMVRTFQEAGCFAKTTVASVIHSGLYLMPYQYYHDIKGNLAKDAKFRVTEACRGKFDFQKVRILNTESSSNEEIVSLLSKHAESVGANLLVVGNHDRKGLPYWLLGSLSETASLAASLPVLVIKSTIQSSLSNQRNIVVGIDVSAPPSAGELAWLERVGKFSESKLHLIYVLPKIRPVVERLQHRQTKVAAENTLNIICKTLGARGVEADYSVLQERQSIAHTITKFADRKCAWITITTTAKRSRVRKLLLGSNARHVLTLSKRPFLSLRLQ
jgi:nucleotide-binding universal stress UspA family protein